MNPPTEQLIRDYLNQLSIAARRRLGFLERQMLLNHTRARIEAECGDPASASVAEIKRALSDLGDPEAVVEAAHARVSMRKPAPAGAVRPAPVSAGGSAKGSALQAERGAERRRGRLPLRVFIPRPAGTPEPAQHRPGSGDPAAGSANGAGSSADPARSGEAEGVSADPAMNGAGRTVRAAWTAAGRRTTQGRRRVAAAGTAAARRLAQGRRHVAAAGAAIGHLAKLALGLAAIARRHKLETFAVLLLGVGGVVFPPVWLLGAVLAVTSRVWDIRDKWIALALPVLGTLVGATLVIVMGGQRGSLSSYAYEAWLGAGRLVRVLVALSAVYLLWQLRQGPKKPRQPPWNVPHKLDL